MLQDLKVAIVFLTRIPVHLAQTVTMRDLAAAVHFFPVVGIGVGLIGSLGFAAASWLGLPSFPAALIALGAMILVTGALHEDGLADTADALGAGSDRERALAIMRDSRIGSFGAIALIFSLTLRVAALAPLWNPQLVAAVLVTAAAASRAAMPVVMLVQPSAKATGLAAQAGRPEPSKVAIGVMLAVVTGVLVMPAHRLLPALAALAATAFVVATWLGRRFGGCTGDTLGTVQQAAEIGFLLGVMARL